MPPQLRLKNYELFERIGTGAESVIYRARNTASGQIVAIKHVCVDEPEKYKYLRHMLNEYKTLRAGGPLMDRATGRTNGIVKVHRLIRTGRLRRRKELSLVMQYVDGLDLRKEHRYPIGQLVDILAQVAVSLSNLHSRRIIHGDLKPENIIVSPNGQATLVDFGFSCRTGSPATSIRGTRDYMAPEQVNMGQLTEKTDIYNFGATMYYLFSGKHLPALIPAVGEASHFIAGDISQVVSPRSLNPRVPPLLSDIILRSVRKVAIERPSCIEEVLGVLNEVRSHLIG